MKKLLYCAAALAAMFFTACQQEGLEPVAKENTVTYSVNVSNAATKAVGDDLTAIDKLYYEVYRELEVGDLTKSPIYEGEATVANGTAFVTLEFVKNQNFVVLFWAQDEDLTMFNHDDLRKVTLVTPGAANNVNAQVFAGSDEVINCVSTAGGNVTLVRPISQLNIGTSVESLTIGNAVSNSEVGLVKTLTVKVAGLPSVYNVATKGVDVDAEYVYTESVVLGETFNVAGVDYAYVAMNYVGFAPEASTTADVEFTFETTEGDIAHAIANVPFKPNYRTNIIGNLITSENEYNVTLEAGFNSFEYVVEDNTNFVSVSSAEELYEAVSQIAEGDEECANIQLNGDIDLADLVLTRAAVTSNWTPVGTSEKPFTGVFDGNGYTIKNLTLVEPEAKEGKAYIGFFGYAKDATIKNVTFENVYINIPCLDIDHSQGHIGAVAGSLEGTCLIEDVTVKGDIQVYATQDANGASRVAVVAGGNAYGNVTMKNVHVIANEGSSLIANNNIGALAGQLQGKMYFENCSSNINVTANKFFAGGLVGIAAGDSKFVNCHTTGDVAVVAGREGRHNDEYRVGGIAGGWADGKTKVCTLENCSYTGKVSGMNADGTVAEPLDYAGYVGRGYTLTNCAGSKVLIDNLGFVQKYDNQYGIYTVISYVKNAEELQEAINAGNDVVFLNDIQGDVTVAQSADVKLNIDGDNHKFAGVITVDGKSATYTTAGLTIKNVNFSAETISADACVRLGNGENATRYTCNVTVENCTFDVLGAVGVKSYTGGDKNLTIKGCTATAKAHSLVQAKGIDGVLVENCTVNSKNGMNFNNSTDVTVNNCTAAVRGYAVRFGESSGGSGAAETYAISNSTLKSACADGDAVIILRGTADNSTLTITNTTLEGTTQLTNNAAGAKVLIDGVVAVTTADGLVDALENKFDVIFMNDIKIEPASMSNAYGATGINVKYGQTIDGNGHTLNIKGAGGTWDSGINTTGGLIKNLTVTGSFRGIFINHTSDYSEKVVLENVTIGGNGTVYTISCDQGLYQGIEATNCTFNGWTSFAKTAGEAKFVNCNFGAGSGYKYCRPYSNTEFVGCTFCPGYAVDTTRATVTFTDCTWEE